MEEQVRSADRALVRSLLPLGAFLLISAFALRDFADLPNLPESLRAFLGFSPSPAQISLALLVYSLSAALLAFRRLLQGLRPERSSFALAYLTAFYGFYHFAGGTLENRAAVFVSGLVILALEACAERACYTRLRGQRPADRPPGGT